MQELTEKDEKIINEIARRICYACSAGPSDFSGDCFGIGPSDYRDCSITRDVAVEIYFNVFKVYEK